MTAALLRLSALGGAAVLIAPLPVSAESLALWGVVVTSLASLIKGVLDKREERLLRAQQHKFDVEDRALGRATTIAAQRALQTDIAANTALTRDAAGKADLAYETANHVNAKIAGIAEAALTQDRASASVDRTAANAAIKQDRAMKAASLAEDRATASDALKLDRATASDTLKLLRRDIADNAAIAKVNSNKADEYFDSHEHETKPEDYFPHGGLVGAD